MKFCISPHFSTPFGHVGVTAIAVLISEGVMPEGGRTTVLKVVNSLWTSVNCCDLLGKSSKYMSLIITLFLCVGPYRCLTAQEEIELKLVTIVLLLRSISEIQNSVGFLCYRFKTTVGESIAVWKCSAFFVCVYFFFFLLL